MKPVVIIGCTASGKSNLAETLAVRLAEKLRKASTLMAVDSMQVYRGMDIGTAKPDAETRGRFNYQMLDLVKASESYSTARFVNDASPVLAAGEKAGGAVILVAGTFLYLRSLMEGLFEGPSADEGIRGELQKRAEEIGLEGLHAELKAVDAVAAGRIHANDIRRVVRALEVYRITGTPISTLQTQWSQKHPAREAIYIGIRREKESLSRRINARVKGMMAAGLVEEVARIKDGGGFSEEAAGGVGYRQILDYFDRRCTLEEAVEQVKIQTRYLAKMQRTWMKRWPTPSQVVWLDAEEEQNGAELVEGALQAVERGVE